MRDPEKVKAYHAKWRAANLEKIRQNTARFRLQNPDYQKLYVQRNRKKYQQFSRKYQGLPEATRTCPAVCECCGKPPGAKAIALDHDHKTGKFRGWLCQRCNTAIGMLGDNIFGVLCALDYLLDNT